MPDTRTTQPSTDSSPRIGARLVVELLALRAEEPLTDKIRLTPQRSKHAVLVLNDKFNLIHKTLNLMEVQCSIAHALEEHCSDLEIPLPVAGSDWGAIQLVDQLFDILEQQLAKDREAAQWFARLRLLVVRYALKDYSFFFAPQNLLRRFLNQAYLTQLSTTEKSRLVHREQLHQFAKRMLAEPDSEVGRINSICIEAQAWFAGQSEKVEQIETRLRVLEITRRREKVAEPRVTEELNRMTHGTCLPLDVIEFLQGEWRRSMLMMSMREGVDGSDWKRQLRTTESLIELCQGCQDEAERNKYKSFYQVLMRNLRALLISVNEEAEALEATLAPLELVLSALISGAAPPLQNVVPLPVPRNQVLEASLSRVSPKSLETIEQLAENDWLRLKTSSGHFELCKIVLKAQQDDPWVLVSQSGKTIAKKNALQLAQALEGGVIQLVHRVLFWDREVDGALQQLYSQWLEQRARKPAGAPEPPESKVDRIAETVSQTGSDAHVDNQPSDSRIDALLEHSSLSLLEVEPAASPAQSSSNPVSGAVTEPESALKPEEEEAFLAPRPVSEAEMAAALAAVDSIQVGGWISQETSDGEQRCKLAVKIKASDKLVFVNRLGIKILDITRPELARLLVHGAVTILDTGAAFDSTLERVVRSIQKEKQ